MDKLKISRNFADKMTDKKSKVSEYLVKCSKCAIVIYTELALYVVCSGTCGHSFHIACVGMGRDHLRALKNGLMWMCGECLVTFNDWKNSQQKSTPPTDLGQLHCEIAEMKSQISLIVDTLQRTASNEISSDSQQFRHSTPTTYAKMCTSNDIYERDTKRDNQSAPNVHVRPTVKDDHFSLLLTNISNNVLESDVESMVCRCLGAPMEDCLNVVKLVSRRTDCRLLDYISFKVILKDRWKDLALSNSTWPNGIEFREFECRRKNAWKP